MRILKTLGIGRECVYVYYYPNDRLLAEAIGSAAWECKIGMTTTGDIFKRISEQGYKTARHQEPVVALEIRTNNAVLLESKLHRVFYAERLNSGKITGDEWFMINPQQIEDYYNSDNHQSELDIVITDFYIVDDLHSLGRTVRDLRKQMKLRQEDMGLSRMTVNRLENSLCHVQTDSLFELLDKLGCTLAIVPKNKL